MPHHSIQLGSHKNRPEKRSERAALAVLAAAAGILTLTWLAPAPAGGADLSARGWMVRLAANL